MKPASNTSRPVKSWFGFFFALTIAAVNFYLWLTGEDERFMLLGFGCLFWIYPWSQTSGPIHKFFAKESASAQPLAQTLRAMGWGLLITSVIYPIFP